MDWPAVNDPYLCETGMKLSNKEFDKIVQRAIRRIPDEIRQHLDNILITVQQWPDPESAGGDGVPAG